MAPLSPPTITKKIAAGRAGYVRSNPAYYENLVIVDGGAAGSLSVHCCQKPNVASHALHPKCRSVFGDLSALPSICLLSKASMDGHAYWSHLGSMFKDKEFHLRRDFSLLSQQATCGSSAKVSARRHEPFWPPAMLAIFCELVSLMCGP